MFQKLRTSRYLKASGRENRVVVEFTGKVLRIARVHHFGLKDRANQHSHDMVYPKRQLLGSSVSDTRLIEQIVIRYFEL
nr:MAG TPA: virion morphogenesis protein [Caudoviricetes sp.]